MSHGFFTGSTTPKMSLVLPVKLILCESVAAQFVPAGAVRAGGMYGQDRIIEWSAAGSVVTTVRPLVHNIG
jgi:hypothetical protein